LQDLIESARAQAHAAGHTATVAPDALFIALGNFSDLAVKWAQQHRVVVWRAPEFAQKLRAQALTPCDSPVLC
jgi:hypothetical protein